MGVGEREFLISPSLGSITMTALGLAQLSDSRFVTAKKPFDWMLDEQYGHLQILATHYEWFQEMFDRSVLGDAKKCSTSQCSVTLGNV